MPILIGNQKKFFRPFLNSRSSDSELKELSFCLSESQRRSLNIESARLIALLFLEKRILNLFKIYSPVRNNRTYGAWGDFVPHLEFLPAKKMISLLTLIVILFFTQCLAQNRFGNQVLSIDCDSIYKNLGYRIIQTYYQTGLDSSGYLNDVFQFICMKEASPEVLMQDTIYSSTRYVMFQDFNQDGIKDVLVQNSSDSRSNWTYYLYLVDPDRAKLTRVKGFDLIKNPRYLPQHDLIDNYVNSGRNWTGFYKIRGDTVMSYEICIFDGPTDSEKEQYLRAHREAIASILKDQNTNR